MLVQTDHVPGRVTKSRSYLGRVNANWLDDLTAIGNDRGEGRGNDVNHDVNKKTRFSCG